MNLTTHNYTYDVLNRLVQETHLDPSAGTDKYAYDGTALTGCPGPTPPAVTGATNLVGRRSAMCSGNSSSSWSYDPMGRPLVEARNNKGSAAKVYNVGYTYYTDGSLKTLTYPSGDVLTYSVGGAALPLQVKDSSNNFATSVTYTPSGLLTGMTNGSGIVTSNIYNDRLQPVLLSAAVTGQAPIFSLCYDFHLHVAINSSPCTFNGYQTGDNGNVFQIINNVDSTRSTAFVYDLLNRLSQANTITTTGTNCWSETYTIDAWGNLTNRAGVSGMGSCYTEILNAAPASSKNQLNGIFYDAAGNVTNDGNGNMPTYDSENQIATDNGVTYSYDADGFRMEKSPGNMYWPGPGGEVLAETDLSGTINAEYIYFNGSRLARIDRPSGTVHYYFSDHLGSASAITDASGNVQQKYYYYPYGATQSSTGQDPNHYKFTSKEHDTESNLDYFGARYYGSSSGRFMTPDWAEKPTAVPYANYGNPQSLNLYIYVNNNPTTLRDPDGHGKCVNSGLNMVCDADDTQKAQNTSGKTIAKGAGEVGLGGAAIGLAIVLAPETGGGSLAALGVAAGVLGGTAEVGNGIVDIAHGAGQVDAQTAEEAKQGINIANNPVAANALIVTNANNAERIGNVANGVMALHDIAQRPEGVADTFNKLMGARDVKEGYQSAKELMHQVGSYLEEKAPSLYQYF